MPPEHEEAMCIISFHSERYLSGSYRQRPSRAQDRRQYIPLRRKLQKLFAALFRDFLISKH